ncbi:7622_t:CDS:1, partial [Rhizophagus irregularis]
MKNTKKRKEAQNLLHIRINGVKGKGSELLYLDRNCVQLFLRFQPIFGELHPLNWIEQFILPKSSKFLQSV